ncbi:hypothetical protein E4U21_007055 [Claviceps maximensis]|nr:hypothetical protein E4U21_007055 [Claviceps maximensis]
MSSSRLDANNDAMAERGDRAGLLSPMAYDDDASSLHSRSEQDSDSDDDQLQLRARNSRELRAADRIVLMEEEELDRLVTTTRQKQERQRQRSGSGLSVPNALKIFGRRPGSSPLSSPNASTEKLVASDKRTARRTRRKQKRNRLLDNARHGEDGELMYEMEEGGMKDGSSTGDSSEREDSEEADRRRLDLVVQAARGNRRGSWRRWIFLHSLIAIGFAMLVLISWKLSRNRRSATAAAGAQHLVSNGTTLFAPTTIILSLDGFRADFLHRGLTPRLSALVQEGVSPPYMTPSFPSLTFPNHYTLATGLYPEAHGIVGNSFWDPDLQAEFYYTDPARSLDAKWWAAGEPFWVSAEKQGVRTAVHMWPGSEAPIQGIFASVVDKFNEKEALDNKVSRILGLLDLPGPSTPPPPLESIEETTATTNTRPQLIAAYVPNVDADGHKYGPNSTEIRSTIQSVDSMLDNLFHGLQARNLTHIVNIIVVSDHGMATTDTFRLIQLEDLVDTTKIEHTDGWPLYGLRPKNEQDTPLLYAQLQKKAAANPNFDVYLRDADMPPQYHFQHNNRIAPLWLVPKTGWAIVQKHEVDVEQAKASGQVYHPRGLHGYDHLHPLMRAIFVARGPAFPHPANSMIEPFQNINVYNILCDTLGITPRPNNGTLRLPFRPIGTHSPENQEPHPVDPPPSLPTSEASSPHHPDILVDPPQPPRPHPIAPDPSSSSSSVTTTTTTDPHKGDAPVRPVKATSSPTYTLSSAAAPRPTDPQHAIDQQAASGEDKDAGKKAEEEEKEDEKHAEEGKEKAAHNEDEDQNGDASLDAQVKGWWKWITHKVNGVWDAVTGSNN